MQIKDQVWFVINTGRKGNFTKNLTGTQSFKNLSQYEYTRKVTKVLSKRMRKHDYKTLGKKQRLVSNKK